jgi:outer membrane protein
VIQRIAFGLLLGFSIGGFSTALAQNQTLSSRPNATLVPPVRPFLLPPRTGIETQMDISLDQTLAMALANNKDIESARIDQQESDYTLTAALGAFDPQLTVTSYWEQQVTPIASALGGSSTGSLLNKTWQADPAITQPLPWYGGTFRTDLSSADAYSNNTFLSLNPQYETSLNFSYTQPLWRNLMYDSNRHQIDVAKKNILLTDEQFRQRVMTIVQQAE